MKKSQNQNTVDYWDSLADGMVALFLCILLIALLFVLYFVRSARNYEHVDDAVGDGAGSTEMVQNVLELADDHHYDDPEPGNELHQQEEVQSGGGGDGGGDGGEDEERPRETPREWEETLPYSEEGEKSAVLVKVVDGETLLPLARAGITFELYDEGMRLQTLNDYYPARVEHTTFETTEAGQFFLPEKIHRGNYLLRAMTDVEGYSPAEDTPFSIESYYDWTEPYTVTVMMLPLRSVIRVQLVDRDSKEGLPGGSFQVIAAENIVTLDGSVRFHAGETVDTIMLDANGYGESQELYFGKYILRQELVPDFYGILSQDVHTELKEKTDNIETLSAEKTVMLLTVRDALYDNITIPGVEFTVSGGSGPMETLVSDTAGQIRLTDLQKNTTYRIRQTGAAADYRMDTAEYAFTVDGSGLIQGAVRQEMSIENRMIRSSFQVTGTLLGDRVSDIRMVLTDLEGNIVKQWTTSGQDTLITGLEPGTYRLMIGSDLDNPVEVFISDEASVQEFRFTRWTMTDTGIVSAAGAFLVGALLIIFAVWRSKKRSRRGANMP